MLSLILIYSFFLVKIVVSLRNNIPNLNCYYSNNFKPGNIETITFLNKNRDIRISPFASINSPIKNQRLKALTIVRYSSTRDEFVNITSSNPSKKSKNLMRRWITGLSLGAICTIWIYSGNGIFTLGFLLTSLIAQNEYYSMLRAIGILPTKKIGMVTSLISYVTAAMYPKYHELVMPLSATLLMVWLLIFNKKSASISEISTSLLGMFYIGYLPSFWVRLRGIEGLNNLRFFPSVLNSNLINHGSLTIGATMTWWTWTSIVFADVGAYFVGKKFGKHKLSTISSAAGSASPNKSVEGALAGFASCIVLSLLGAYVMQWPFWNITGFFYGLMIGVIALVGDLTASMMKRDAGVKDTGNILPGHGGLLDRIDSYMFTAPAAYFFCLHVLPLAAKLKKII